MRESLAFVLQKLRQVHPFLVANAPGSAGALEKRLQQYARLEVEVRRLVLEDYFLGNSAVESLFAPVRSQKWDTREIQSQSSPFVPRVQRFLEDYQDKLQSANGGSIPGAVQVEIFAHLSAYLVNRYLREICEVRKITVSGWISFGKDLSEIIKHLRKMFREHAQVLRELADLESRVQVYLQAMQVGSILEVLQIIRA